MIELMDDCNLLTGNCVETLKTLEANSVHTCITSPPYYGLRDYGTATWEGGDESCEHTISHYADSLKPNVSRPIRDPKKRKACAKCGAIRIDKQIGLEDTPEEFIENLVLLFREVKRVLRDDGTLWVNIGDSYWGGKGASGQSDSEYQERRASKGESFNRGHHQIGGSKKTRPTDKKHPVIKPKDLVGIPWMLAFALRADGWYLRQDIIWAKPNPMPESVKDRCTKNHEYIFLLSKSKHYYYDHEAIKEEAHSTDKSNRDRDNSKLNNTPGRTRMAGLKTNHYTTKNKRSVWNVSCKPFKGAHFAVFPPELIEPCVLAGCPKGGTVLDPFGGSGTTAGVALKHGRKAILCELNSDYVDLIPKRIEAVSGRSKEQRTLFDW